MEWRGENLSRLRELAASPEMLSAREIAAHFGCGRNAIIGACLRNNIKLLRPASKGKRAQRQPRAQRRRPFQPFSGNIVNHSTLKCVPIDPLHLSLTELERDCCRFPYGGDGGEPITFCGHPRHGDESYCRLHYEICRSMRPGLNLSDAERERRRRRMQHVRASFETHAA